MTMQTELHDPARERIDAHLDTIDWHDLAAELATVAAERGFTVQVEPRLIHIENEPCANAYAVLSDMSKPVTIEVLSDLINFFRNAIDLEELMNIYSTDLFKYLAGDMIGGSQVTLTIINVTQERMNSGKGGEQVKPVLHFKERDKMMVLNKTNAQTIARELGPETDNWTGGRVTLNAPQIEAFGRQTRSIRVIKVEPPQTADKPRATVAKPAPATNGTDAPLFEMEPTPAALGAYQE